MEKLKKTMMIIFAVAILMMPVVSIAGDLEPSAAPAPTMKTLDQIPPTWSQKLQCDTTATCPRFEVVLDGAAVLDKETGLVWARSVESYKSNWYYALDTCTNKEVGGRKGWHLPTIEQLASLVDTSAPLNLKLPTGHPFTYVAYIYYWSISTCAESTTSAWVVYFNDGSITHFEKTNPIDAGTWCVRGGQSNDGY